MSVHEEHTDPRPTSSQGAIEGIYARWGRHPLLYAAQDWLTFLGRPHHIRGRAVEATGVTAGARLLEVGCGTGRNFPHIEERIGPGGELVGLDYSHEMLAAARDLAARQGWANVRLVRGDAAALDVGDDVFDGVLSVLAMSVVPDYRAALHRCHDVLRPGGKLAICDAHLPTGRLSVIHPLLRAVYVPTTGWDPDRDLPGELRRVFGNVTVESLNIGTLFIASATKRP